MHRSTPKVPLLLLGLPLLLTACGTHNTPDAGTTPTAEATPHGYIEGAQENAEPQTGLLTFDRETGEAQLLSLLTEEKADAGTFGPVDAVHLDVRYAFISSGDTVEVFDTGAWTVPHGDHKHYYSTEPKPVGTIEIPDPGSVAGDGSTVAVFSDSEGYASLYSVEDLDAGEITDTGRITTSPHDGGVVVPFKDSFLASTAETGSKEPDGVEVRDSQDQTVLAKESCPGLSSHAQTRVGVVFSCTDGALLFTENDGAFTPEHIPYPSGAADPVVTLEHRPGSNELAGPAGDDGVWHLDVSDRTWTLLETPVAAVTAAAVGDSQRVLAIGTDGSLLSLNPASGEILTSVELLDADTDQIPQLRIDTSRAYVSDPASSTVYEIDYADNLRVARTFDVPAVDFLLETGL